MVRRFVAGAAALAFVAGACGGSGDPDTDTSSSKRTTTTESAPTTTAGTGRDLATATSAGSSSPATNGGTDATARSGSPARAADTNAAPTPARQGTYDYAQSGSTAGEPAPPSGTLVVTGPGPSQVFKRYFDPAQPPTDIFFTFRDDGPVITRVIVRERGFVVNCGFGTPVPAPPWPPTAGRTFSGRATCDNGFQADFSGSIGGRVDDNVGGVSVETIVINSTLHITGDVFGAAVDVTVRDTQHWAPSLRLPTFSHEVISGTVSGEVTSRLTSVNPR